MGKRNVKVNEVTRGNACMACGDTTHSHTNDDRRRRCPYKDKQCPKCKRKEHYAMGERHNKEQTKPNNLTETGAEDEVSASAIGSKRVVCKYSVPVKPKPN